MQLRARRSAEGQPDVGITSEYFNSTLAIEPFSSYNFTRRAEVQGLSF